MSSQNRGEGEVRVRDSPVTVELIEPDIDFAALEEPATPEEQHTLDDVPERLQAFRDLSGNASATVEPVMRYWYAGGEYHGAFDDEDYNEPYHEDNGERTPVDPAKYSHFFEPMPHQENEDELLNCDICMERMTTDIKTTTDATVSSVSDDGAPPPEQAVFLKKCSHRFGALCLATWLSQTLTCPMCRAVLDFDSTAADENGFLDFGGGFGGGFGTPLETPPEQGVFTGRWEDATDAEWFTPHVPADRPLSVTEW